MLFGHSSDLLPLLFQGWLVTSESVRLHWRRWPIKSTMPTARCISTTLVSRFCCWKRLGPTAPGTRADTFSIILKVLLVVTACWPRFCPPIETLKHRWWRISESFLSIPAQKVNLISHVFALKKKFNSHRRFHTCLDHASCPSRRIYFFRTTQQGPDQPRLWRHEGDSSSYRVFHQLKGSKWLDYDHPGMCY